MPQYYSSSFASTAGTGTATDPWRTLPGTPEHTAAGFPALAAGDVVNVLPGSTWTNTTLTPAANYLTYRAWPGRWGHNPLTVRLPGRIPGTTRSLRVNSGMWRIDNRNSAEGVDCINVSGGTRMGVIIEDFHAMGCKRAAIPTNSGRLVRVGNSAATTAGGHIFRRCLLENAGTNAMPVFHTNVLVELCVFRDIPQDGIVFYAETGNSRRVNSFDCVRFCEFDNCGAVVGDPGDAIQYAGADGFQAGNFLAYGNYIRRLEGNKQAILLAGKGFQAAVGNYLHGDNPNVAVQAGILFNSLQGYGLIARNVINKSSDQGIRLSDALNSTGNEAMSLGPNAVLDVEDNLMIGGSNYFLRLGNTPHGANSRIRSRRNRVIGDLSVGFYTTITTGTFDATFRLTSEDNEMVGNVGSGIVYNFGDHNFSGDRAEFIRDRMPASNYRAGGQTYTTPEAFAAYNNVGKTAATLACDIRSLTSTEAAYLDTVGKISTNSPLYMGGGFDRHRLDVYGDLHTVPRRGGRLPF